MGRKNVLFLNTDNDAEVSVIIYDLVESAKGNNINVFEHLQTVLLYMPKNEPTGIEDVLPLSDFIKERCSADRTRKFNKENWSLWSVLLQVFNVVKHSNSEYPLDCFSLIKKPIGDCGLVDF